MSEVVVLKSPDDMHLHPREGEMLWAVLPYSEVFARALMQPNTKEGVKTAAEKQLYAAEIEAARDPRRSFEPLFTIKLTPKTTPQIIREAKEEGVLAAKLYPEGVTTGSEIGITDYAALDPVLGEMSEVGMVFSVHGELPGVSSLCAERAFLEVLDSIVKRHPELLIVLEHLSTQEAVEWVRRQSERVAATITLHHLLLTVDDVIGPKLNPHNFCKPVPKTAEDRLALQEAVLGGEAKFFFGSDSAPHPRSKKEKEGAAGVFSALAALPALWEFFLAPLEDDPRLAKKCFEQFTALHGAKFYRLPINSGTIRLIRRPWVVPDEISVPGTDDTIVPFFAGKELEWQVEVA